ncbi:hypothetical protein [Azospirillum sp.]|uniref:hypothetical protein n=1 Tax=Azospirillum sp. TaxID=34012 RepID=UPI002D51B28B|nr:hypothetical protein [Azospirillum sp.]HYD66499.1 hypothetical protein [Azospirillum sp.]
MRLRPLSLRGYLVALVLGALVPMLILGGTLIGWLAEEQRKSMEQGLLESAKAPTLAIDREIDANPAALQGLAAADTLGDGNLPVFYDRMQLALRQHPYWANIALLDAVGQQLLHTAKPMGAPLPNVATFDFVRRAMETGKPTVSDLITGPVAGRLNIAILFPVLRDGHLTHILAAVVNAEAWSALLREFSTEPGPVIAASDRQRRIIARNRDAEAYIGREGPAWAREFLDQATSGIARGTAL